MSSLLESSEVREVEPWDPVAEGFCGKCGGEGGYVAFADVPFPGEEHAGVPVVCPECQGTGLINE